MTRHGARTAVFVDESGRRAARVRVVMRVVIGILTAALGFAVVSSLTGLSLPELAGPSTAPSSGRQAAGAPARPTVRGAGATTSPHAPGRVVGARPDPTRVPDQPSSAARAVAAALPVRVRPSVTAAHSAAAAASAFPSSTVPAAPPSTSVPPGSSASSRRRVPSHRPHPSTPGHGRHTTPPPLR